MSMKNFPDLAKFAARPVPVGYPVEEHITLYAPDDNLHGALGAFIDSVEHSLSLAMYGFDDDTLATAVLRKLQDPKVFVQLCLDSTQAAGVHEKALLATVNYPSNVVAFGHSEGGAIMHLKTGVMDGLDCFSGSTNWSESGESKQDNELSFTRHPMIAFRLRHKIDLIHASMLTQMDAKRVAGGQ
jgi:phosphatidylserine/phosphatidylglycerophosphate/cardiolipin synthase-like enzyme